MEEIIEGRKKTEIRITEKPHLALQNYIWKSGRQDVFYMKTYTIPGPLSEITDVINKTMFKTTKKPIRFQANLFLCS